MGGAGMGTVGGIGGIGGMGGGMGGMGGMDMGGMGGMGGTGGVMCSGLLFMDPLELARQWTLLDHALFCAIPLQSLQLGVGEGELLYAKPRHQQLQQGGSGMFQGVRGFIDRFNGLSSWVSHTVLNKPTPGGRAEVISYFIKVASHMGGLCNFNGVMAILTGLQQGCVARLSQSWVLVTAGEKLKLTTLQTLLSGSKNYSTYRAEVKQLSLHFSGGGAGIG
ncbi:ras guanine nucleotide exchange factor domain-containing protein, partial [Ochromonadaceae sp. CCMP2298]